MDGEAESAHQTIHRNYASHREAFEADFALDGEGEENFHQGPLSQDEPRASK